MNDMPETLEDAIKQLNELRSAYMKRMEDIQELNTEINRLSALLPPEGETRPKHDLLFVDATPDDGYIARILSAYLDDSYYSDNTDGLPPSNPLIVKMNEWREQRNALLRAELAERHYCEATERVYTYSWGPETSSDMLERHERERKELEA